MARALKAISRAVVGQLGKTSANAPPTAGSPVATIAATSSRRDAPGWGWRPIVRMAGMILGTAPRAPGNDRTPAAIAACVSVDNGGAHGVVGGVGKEARHFNAASFIEAETDGRLETRLVVSFRSVARS